jgi:uncharacterized protein (DUF2147 family)
MKRIAFVLIALLTTFNTFGQIEGYWEYKKNKDHFVIKIEQKNDAYIGTIVKTTSRSKNALTKFNKVLMVDFKNTATDIYKGYFVLKNHKKHKGRIIQIDSDTIEMHYKWVFFKVKDTWKKIEQL